MGDSEIGSRLEAAFGWRSPPRPLFYQSEIALRFELGGEEFGSDRRPSRVMQALDRARTVARALFQPSRAIWALVARWDLHASEESPFKAETLIELGFDLPPSRTELIRTTDDEVEFETRWDAFGLQEIGSLADTLIWASVTLELGIRPSAATATYFVDFERRVLLHIYDDRGMDVVAMDPASLVPIYREFGGWLLDYDRARMDATFAGLAVANPSLKG